MDTDHDVARAARNLIAEHGGAAKTIALARAKHAEASNSREVARRWLDIAAAVSRLHVAEIASSLPQGRRTPSKRTDGA